MNRFSMDVVARMLYQPLARGLSEGEVDAPFAEAHRLLDGCWNVERAGNAFVCSLLVNHPEHWEDHPRARRVMLRALRLRWQAFAGANPIPREWDAVYADLKEIDDERRGRLVLGLLTGDTVQVVEMYRALETHLPLAGWRAAELRSEDERVRWLLLEHLTPWLETPPDDEEEAFHLALRADPSDPGPIALYYDWLTEHESPRARAVEAIRQALFSPEPLIPEAEVEASAAPAPVDFGAFEKPHEPTPLRRPLRLRPRLPARLSEAMESATCSRDAWQEPPEQRDQRLRLLLSLRRRSLTLLVLSTSAVVLATIVACIAVGNLTPAIFGLLTQFFVADVWGRRYLATYWTF